MLKRATGHRAGIRGAVLLLALTAIVLTPTSTLAQDTTAEELPPPGTALEAGRYWSSAVGPRIEFRVGEGWLTGPPPDGPIFTLERTDPPGTFLTVTRFDGVTYVDPCDSTSLTDVQPSVPRLMEIIAANPFLNPAPPKAIDVDGNLGFSLDVATPPFEECTRPELLLWRLPMPRGEFIQVAGQQSRFVAVDVEGDVIVFAIESFPFVPFGTLLDASMDIVESARIEPGEYVPASPSPEPEPSASPTPAPEATDPPAEATA